MNKLRQREAVSTIKRFFFVCSILGIIFLISVLVGILNGSSSIPVRELLSSLTGDNADATVNTILWRIRLPRVLLAALAGASLSLGGMVFQAILRNPLAEPYILGISGGSAVGAISGILLGLSFFPGVTVFSFLGSMLVLGAVLLLAGDQVSTRKDFLLLGGVMMNVFCGAIIMFLISVSQGPEVKQIIFWLMGDLSLANSGNLVLLLLCFPCFGVILIFSRPLNIILTGRESATAMGINVRLVSTTLLVTTSVMVSLVVCQSGLIGFVGLLIPHFFRMTVGADHRLLGPCCILGGSSFLIICDLLARTLPEHGEIPVGIVTALIGAPLFIFLLWRSRK